MIIINNTDPLCQSLPVCRMLARSTRQVREMPDVEDVLTQGNQVLRLGMIVAVVNGQEETEW